MFNYRSTLSALRTLKATAPARPEWLRALRADLAQRIALEAPIVRPASFKFGLVHSVIFGSFTLLVFGIIGTGVGFAAQSQLPGETLYGVKLFLEEIHTSLAPSVPAKVKVVLNQASRRIFEAKSLAAKPESEAGVKIALDNFGLKVAAATSELVSLEAAGKTADVVSVAEALTQSSTAHQAELKSLSTTTILPQVLAVVTEAEKVSLATETVAEKAILTNAIAADDKNTPPSPTNVSSVVKIDAGSTPPATGKDLPPLEVAPSSPKDKDVAKVNAEATPEVSNSVPLENRPNFAIARARAVQRLDLVALRLKEYSQSFSDKKASLAPENLANLNKQFEVIKATLAEAEAALDKDDLLTAHDKATAAMALLIDIESSLKLAPAPANPVGDTLSQGVDLLPANGSGINAPVKEKLDTPATATVTPAPKEPAKVEPNTQPEDVGPTPSVVPVPAGKI